MLTLYDYLPSGNGYKVRLLLHRLAIPFRLVELDIGRGETRTPEFLAKNPAGQIPLLEFADGTHLAQSGAMIWYFAEDTELAPGNRIERACNVGMDGGLATIQPDNVDAFIGLGNAYYNRDLYKESIQPYKRAVEISPEVLAHRSLLVTGVP